ncbi:MAG: beta-phosphoglucomutase [Lachnospiraceae bacterium]|nr:beta-phosphoglucomutase [Lachnospiraceae bacterium]
MKFKGIIFDLDGVLVHTDKLHYRAWKKIADARGISFNEEMNNLLRGVSRMESLEIILRNYHGPALSEDEKLAIAEEKNSYYKEELKAMTPADVTEEVREALSALKAAGMKVAIGSSSKNTKFILKQVGLYQVFDAVSDGTNIRKSKPDPEVFLKAAEYISLAPSECLVVEDAVAGIEAAKSGGMKAAGIGDAASYEKTDYRLATFANLKDIVL